MRVLLLSLWFTRGQCGLGEMASRETLPQGLFDDCLDILKKLASNDRDLIRIVVEIISDMRDPFIDEPEEPVRRVLFD